MATYSDLQQVLDRAMFGRFSARPMILQLASLYPPESRVVINVPFDQCDSIVTVASHPYDYAVKVDETIAGLESLLNVNEEPDFADVVNVLIANGCKLDLSAG